MVQVYRNLQGRSHFLVTEDRASGWAPVSLSRRLGASPWDHSECTQLSLGLHILAPKLFPAVCLTWRARRLGTGFQGLFVTHTPFQTKHKQRVCLCKSEVSTCTSLPYHLLSLHMKGLLPSLRMLSSATTAPAQYELALGNVWHGFGKPAGLIRTISFAIAAISDTVARLSHFLFVQNKMRYRFSCPVPPPPNPLNPVSPWPVNKKYKLPNTVTWW